MYKKTRFNNKFIIAMIFAIFMAVITDSLKQGVIMMILPDENWSHYAREFDSFTGYFMQLGLVLNLRIWMSYLFKI